MSKLPTKGWCFHRGARLDPRYKTPEGTKPLGVWSCPSCQNYASVCIEVEAPKAIAP